MLNNFCFHVYAQISLFMDVNVNAFYFWHHHHHVTLRMSHVICQMLMLILGTCWTTFVLMSMLKSEYLWLCHISHVTCHNAHVTCQMSNAHAYVDSRDMLNNFCFHVYAQKWVFVIMSHVTLCMSHVTLHMAHVICQMLMLILGTYWTTFVFMSMLKSEYL